MHRRSMSVSSVTSTSSFRSCRDGYSTDQTAYLSMTDRSDLESVEDDKTSEDSRYDTEDLSDVPLCSPRAARPPLPMPPRVVPKIKALPTSSYTWPNAHSGVYPNGEQVDESKPLPQVKKLALPERGKSLSFRGLPASQSSTNEHDNGYVAYVEDYVDGDVSDLETPRPETPPPELTNSARRRKDIEEVTQLAMDRIMGVQIEEGGKEVLPLPVKRPLQQAVKQQEIPRPPPPPPMKAAALAAVDVPKPAFPTSKPSSRKARPTPREPAPVVPDDFAARLAVELEQVLMAGRIDLVESTAAAATRAPAEETATARHSRSRLAGQREAAPEPSAEADPKSPGHARKRLEVQLKAIQQRALALIHDDAGVSEGTGAATASAAAKTLAPTPTRQLTPQAPPPTPGSRPRTETEALLLELAQQRLAKLGVAGAYSTLMRGGSDGGSGGGTQHGGAHLKSPTCAHDSEASNGTEYLTGRDTDVDSIGDDDILQLWDGPASPEAKPNARSNLRPVQGTAGKGHLRTPSSSARGGPTLESYPLDDTDFSFQHKVAKELEYISQAVAAEIEAEEATLPPQPRSSCRSSRSSSQSSAPHSPLTPPPPPRAPAPSPATATNKSPPPNLPRKELFAEDSGSSAAHTPATGMRPPIVPRLPIHHRSPPPTVVALQGSDSPRSDNASNHEEASLKGWEGGKVSRETLYQDLERMQGHLNEMGELSEIAAQLTPRAAAAAAATSRFATEARGSRDNSSGEASASSTSSPLPAQPTSHEPHSPPRVNHLARGALLSPRSPLGRKSSSQESLAAVAAAAAASAAAAVEVALSPRGPGSPRSTAAATTALTPRTPREHYAAALATAAAPSAAPPLTPRTRHALAAAPMLSPRVSLNSERRLELVASKSLVDLATTSDEELARKVMEVVAEAPEAEVTLKQARMQVNAVLAAAAAAAKHEQVTSRAWVYATSKLIDIYESPTSALCWPGCLSEAETVATLLLAQDEYLADAELQLAMCELWHLAVGGVNLSAEASAPRAEVAFEPVWAALEAAKAHVLLGKVLHTHVANAAVVQQALCVLCCLARRPSVTRAFVDARLATQLGGVMATHRLVADVQVTCMALLTLTAVGRDTDHVHVTPLESLQLMGYEDRIYAVACTSGGIEATLAALAAHADNRRALEAGATALWVFATGGLLPQTMLLDANIVPRLTAIIYAYPGCVDLQRPTVAVLLTLANSAKGNRRRVKLSGGKAAIRWSFTQHPDLDLEHLLSVNSGRLRCWAQPSRKSTLKTWFSQPFKRLKAKQRADERASGTLSPSGSAHSLQSHVLGSSRVWKAAPPPMVLHPSAFTFSEPSTMTDLSGTESAMFGSAGHAANGTHPEPKTHVLEEYDRMFAGGEETPVIRAIRESLQQ